MSEQRDQSIPLCPYLERIGAEPTAPLRRPSHRHRCTARGEGDMVAPRTQVTFCLANRHAKCPYYEVGERRLPHAETEPALEPSL
jgi:hypothetical protein